MVILVYVISLFKQKEKHSHFCREKDGKLISELNELKNRVKQSRDKTLHSLHVRRADEKDSGTYTCKVTVKGVPLVLNLEAYGKVRVRTPSNVNIVEGETLKIKCEVIGTPKPKIYWIVSKSLYKITFRSITTLKCGNFNSIS